jgi:uncharacterized membrane protein YhaH (DUF805 family)
MRGAILALSIVALGVIGLGVVVAAQPVGPCPACVVVPLQRLFIGDIGVLVALAAGVLALVNTSRGRDWMAFGALALLIVLVLGGNLYLTYAIRRVTGQGRSPSSGLPQPPLLDIAALLIGLALPVATLLYAVLLTARRAHDVATVGLSALTLIALVAAAPPWVVFNPSTAAPMLTAQAAATSADCARGQYPPIMLQNSGGGTLKWTSFAAFNAVIIAPAAGSLSSGQSQTVALHGSYAASPDHPAVGVEFDSNGGSERVEFACRGVPTATAGAGSALRVSPTSATASCALGEYPPISIRNTGQTAIQWSAITKVAGITLTPASGTLQPGASQAIAISGTASGAFTIFFPSTALIVTITCG